MDELVKILITLQQYEKEAVVQHEFACAVDHTSNNAAYTNGKLVALATAIELVQDAINEYDGGEADIDYDESDFDFELDDDVDEVGYDPYTGCGGWDC